MNQDYNHLQVAYRYIKRKPTSSYVPVADGFVSSAGNPTLAAKYGNKLGANTGTVPVVQYTSNFPVVHKQ